MIVVSDASPLINLAVIGQLNLLHDLFGTIVVPRAVFDEIVVEGGGQPGAESIGQLDWIETKQIENRPLATSLQGELDAGEAEAIVLAVELKADLLLIDERKGRVAAKRQNIAHIGLLGVLIKAKNSGLISAVRPVVDALMLQAGFWISEELYEYVLREAGER